ARGDVFGGFVVEFDQHAVAGGALDEGGDEGGVVGADDQVAFPVAGHGAVGGFGGSFADVGHAGDLRSRRDVASLRVAFGAATAQARREVFAELAFGLHNERVVDRFMRHPRRPSTG